MVFDIADVRVFIMLQKAKRLLAKGARLFDMGLQLFLYIITRFIVIAVCRMAKCTTSSCPHVELLESRVKLGR